MNQSLKIKYIHNPLKIRGVNMTDHIKKEPEDETIIDSAKIYDALRKNY
ncbi:hypothetical protein DC702_004599, partial [Salmonella enterica subsp. enterica serovar Typhi]|nr:hypothetical protein [Salmonella enterica subsp. enterica serovar Typhi]